MRTSAILGLGLAAVATSTPIEARQSSNTFDVSNFVFGCTTTCDWSFDVTIPDSATNHPAVKKAVTCSGSLDDTDYVDCGTVSNTKSIQAYIDSKNQLRLHYHVEQPKKDCYFDYYGHRHVNAATSGKPQSDEFSVKESSATGVC